MEGGGLFIQQLPAVEGFHDGNADSHGFAAAKKRRPFRSGTDAELISLFQIIGRIDGKHHHIDDSRIQHPVGDGRRMGGKSDMMHLSLFLQFFNIIKNTGIYQFVKILVLIHTVQESEIHIVRPKRLQLPGKGFFDDVQIPGPAVFALFIVDRAEMQLKKHLFPLLCNGSPEGLINVFPARAQIKKIDAVLNGGAHHALYFRIRAVLNAAHSKAEGAEFFLRGSVGQLSVLHKILRSGA